MISYLIKSGLCLAILLAFYYLVLEREKMHRFNRFYLLGSILFSFIVPFAIIYVEATPNLAEGLNVITLPESHEVLLEEQPVVESISFTQYFLFFYLFISSLLLIRFIKSFIDIILKIKYNEIVTYQNAQIVLVKDTILPHTFWKYIFINKEDFQEQKIEHELFTHELAHVTQRHTVDVLIVELLQVALWFNPFFYPLKKAIQLNHEFLADDNVIASHQDIPKYQYLLLDKAAWKNKYYLASNLNYSLTKKRLLMMKTKNSKSTILLKKLTIVPLLGGLFFLFADRVEAQSKEKEPKVIEVHEIASEATSEQMKTYEYLLKVSENTQMYDLEDVEKMRRIRSIMSEEQKNSVQNVNEILPPPPPRRITKLNAKEYEKLKDASKYAVWIDKKSVKNSELNKYSYTKFYSYILSFVHENARSKQYPQAYQVTLYTEKYYKSLESSEAVNNLKRVIRKNEKSNGPYLISQVTYEKIKNSKLYVVKIDGKKATNSILNKYTAKDFANHTILRPMPNEKIPHPKVHYSLMTKSYYLKYQEKYKKVPPPPKPVKIEVIEASKAQMDDYKKFLAFFTSKKKNKVIKAKDYKRIQKIYKSMSAAQKKSVKHYRDYIPPPPPPKKLKEAKEVKVKKAPKKKILMREVLGPKGEKEILEVIEEEEEVEAVEMIELKEVLEILEEEEIEFEEAPHLEEVEIVEVHKNLKHKEHKDKVRLKESYKSLVKEGAKFYLNGKKVSAKKIKKYFFENKDEVQTIDVIKNGKTVAKVKLKTK